MLPISLDKVTNYFRGMYQVYRSIGLLALGFLSCPSLNLTYTLMIIIACYLSLIPMMRLPPSIDY